MSRMSKLEAPTVGMARRRRHMEEMIRQQFNLLAQAAMNRAVQTGKPMGDWALESVRVGPDVCSLVGGRDAAEAGAKLFRQAGLFNVEVCEHCSRGGVFVASGAVHP